MYITYFTQIKISSINCFNLDHRLFFLQIDIHGQVSIYLYIAWQDVRLTFVRNNIFDFSFFHGLQQKLTWLFRPPKPPTPISRRPEARFNSPRDGRKQGGVRGVVGGSRTESTEVGGFGVGKSWCEMEQGWHLRWSFCLTELGDGYWVVGGWWVGVPKFLNTYVWI